MIQLTVAGKLGADAVVREVNDKKLAINFSVPHSEVYGKGEDRVEKTLWVECTRFVEKGKDSVAKYLLKGTPVVVIGSPLPQHYKNKEGEIVSKLVCIVDELSFV